MLGAVVDALLADEDVGPGVDYLLDHPLQYAVLLVEELLHLAGVVDPYLRAELGLLYLQRGVDERYLGAVNLLGHRGVNDFLVERDSRDELGVQHGAAGLLLDLHVVDVDLVAVAGLFRDLRDRVHHQACEERRVIGDELRLHAGRSDLDEVRPRGGVHLLRNLFEDLLGLL